MTKFLGQVGFGGAPLRDHSGNLLDAVRVEPMMAIRAPVIDRCPSGLVGIKGTPRLLNGGSPEALSADNLLSHYRRYGVDLLARLRGAYAIAICDFERKRVLLAIDRMGIERLAWSVADGQLVFGTSASEVARVLLKTPRLNAQALFDFMLNHMVPAPDTAFLGVRKLLGGTALEVEGGHVRELRHWEPDFRRDGRADVAELRDSLLPTLRRAVRATRPNAHTGSFLSGGLDSSTVTGLLSELDHDGARAFSVGFDLAAYNELEYARTAARHFRCRHVEYEVTPDDVLANVPRIVDGFDEPFGNSSAVPTLSCVELAKRHDVSHLLAGDGGDELFGGNERYLTQRTFELYAKVPSLVRRAVFDPVARLFHPENSLFPFRKFASYVQQANIPLPERYEAWNLVYREGCESLFSPEFLDRVDPQHQLDCMRNTWRECPSGDLLDRMLWYDWKFTLADNDLRKVRQMCEVAGVDVSFPMLDEEVIDLSLKVPSSTKIERRELRSFFKRATSGFLPDPIIRKQKHGFGLPYGQWLKHHPGLQELTYGSLEALEHRGIFREGFLRAVADQHRGGHPGYYGYAIWDLMMLEQWLQAQERKGLTVEF